MKTLIETAKKKILLAAHRGISAGNIPCNTLAAYEIALRQGADIIELDVAVSADKKLFVFHPGMEKHLLGIDTQLRDMTAEEISKLRFRNIDGTPTEEKIATLDEALDMLRGKTIVNVDKFWTAIPEITACIRAHGMTDDVIVKTSVKTDYINAVEQFAPDLPYMPLIKNTDNITEELLRRRINLVGAEVIFDSESDEVASAEYIEKMHSRRLLLWVNAIIYNYKSQLTAGHSDDAAIKGDPDFGWGWLAKRGFDIIQTDWILPLRLYLEENNLLNR